MSNAPGGTNTTAGAGGRTRKVVFISKATPEDDDLVLWLAPRLEAAGYTVFADILTLEPGDRWRREITGTLQDKAVKMLPVFGGQFAFAAGLFHHNELPHKA